MGFQEYSTPINSENHSGPMNPPMRTENNFSRNNYSTIYTTRYFKFAKVKNVLICSQDNGLRVNMTHLASFSSIVKVKIKQTLKEIFLEWIHRVLAT